MRADADPATPETWPAPLHDGFAGLPPAERIWVALSGGLDSAFLLAATALWFRHRSQAPTIQAIHVHHGLQAEADAWELHCQALCEQLDVPLTVSRIQVEMAGKGLEMAARQARYQAFEAVLGVGDCILLAHHQDDQVETVLYRLIRGSGVRGLAGMPQDRPLGNGHLFRPLLNLSRDQIESWAARWHISGCQDPSNQDRRFDRNFLRHEILPLLKGRWPGTEQSVARAAAHCRETEALLESLAVEDLAKVQSEDQAVLELAPLEMLPKVRQTHLLRYWLRKLGIRPPGQARMLAGLDALVQAGVDRQPSLAWDEYEIRRYRNRLFLLSPAELEVPPAAVDWSIEAPLVWGGRTLVATARETGGLKVPQGRLRVTRRQGGEELVIAGHHHALKQWLQEQVIPPWQRQQLPLIWLDDQLVAIAGLWQDPRFEAGAGEQGWQISWHHQGRNPRDLGGVFD